jgi:hypothetical protein
MRMNHSSDLYNSIQHSHYQVKQKILILEQYIILCFYLISAISKAMTSNYELVWLINSYYKKTCILETDQYKVLSEMKKVKVVVPNKVLTDEFSLVTP